MSSTGPRLFSSLETLRIDVTDPPPPSSSLLLCVGAGLLRWLTESFERFLKQVWSLELYPLRYVCFTEGCRSEFHCGEVSFPPPPTRAYHVSDKFSNCLSIDLSSKLNPFLSLSVALNHLQCRSHGVSIYQLPRSFPSFRSFTHFSLSSPPQGCAFLPSTATNISNNSPPTPTFHIYSPEQERI